MISLRDITYSYDGTTPALKDVSLDIHRGEFLCILGANGSGKSTLGLHLNALLTPQVGHVTVDGLDTSDPKTHFTVRSKVAMVFQNPDDALVSTLVKDEVAFGPANLGLPTAQLQDRVRQSLKAVGLEGFEDRDVNTLSGGQKQRVAIASALAMAPTVLVLDEATAMLDPEGRTAIMRIAAALHSQGMTIVLITHFMEEASLADRVIVLDKGRLVADGAPADVLLDEGSVRAWGLEAPATVRLASLLRQRGIPTTPTLDPCALKEQLCSYLSTR